jgi:hypothetical protein
MEAGFERVLSAMKGRSAATLKFHESCRLDVCYWIDRWIIGFQRSDVRPSQVRSTFPVCR